jgi:suppressor of ftsI
MHLGALIVLLVQQTTLPELPSAHSPVTLTVVTTADGRDAYSYNGVTTAPVIHTRPGARLSVTLINAMSLPSREPCVATPCRQVTNLHFHGFHVSPGDHADDILDLLAAPGDTLHYTVPLPRDHPPGLYWYHPHPHGESDRQVDDGMSGALIVDGIDQLVPAVRGLRERVMVFRVRNAHQHHDQWTLNGAVRPAIEIAPGESQFWRIVNASGDSFLDLAIDSSEWHVVAFDGDPTVNQRLTHIPLPPGGRVEAIVRAPPTATVLTTRAVDTGPDGDPNPQATLADVVLMPNAHARAMPEPRNPFRPKRAIPLAARRAAAEPAHARIVFTEDDHGFYIDGRRFSMADPPLDTVIVGTFVHWRIVNATHEIHPFHIHQVHFLTLGPHPTWRDTVTIPHDDSLDVVLDATAPVIRGLSVFHCHMLRHEDKGMMAKVLFK